MNSVNSYNSAANGFNFHKSNVYSSGNTNNNANNANNMKIPLAIKPINDFTVSMTPIKEREYLISNTPSVFDNSFLSCNSKMSNDSQTPKANFLGFIRKNSSNGLSATKTVNSAINGVNIQSSLNSSAVSNFTFNCNYNKPKTNNYNANFLFKQNSNNLNGINGININNLNGINGINNKLAQGNMNIAIKSKPQSLNPNEKLKSAKTTTIEKIISKSQFDYRNNYLSNDQNSKQSINDSILSGQDSQNSQNMSQTIKLKGIITSFYGKEKSEDIEELVKLKDLVEDSVDKNKGNKYNKGSKVDDEVVYKQEGKDFKDCKKLIESKSIKSIGISKEVNNNTILNNDKVPKQKDLKTSIQSQINTRSYKPPNYRDRKINNFINSKIQKDIQIIKPEKQNQSLNQINNTNDNIKNIENIETIIENTENTDDVVLVYKTPNNELTKYKNNKSKEKSNKSDEKQEKKDINTNNYRRNLFGVLSQMSGK